MSSDYFSAKIILISVIKILASEKKKKEEK